MNDYEKAMQTENRVGELIFTKDMFALSFGWPALEYLRFYPRHLIYDCDLDAFRVLGYSPKFEMVDPGRKPNQYIMNINYEDGIIKFFIEKVKKKLTHNMDGMPLDS